MNSISDCSLGDCNPCCCGYSAAKARAEERKAIFDELYVKLLNEDEETIIEWCQENLIDDVDDYLELEELEG